MRDTIEERLHSAFARRHAASAPLPCRRLLSAVARSVRCAGACAQVEEAAAARSTGSGAATRTLLLELLLPARRRRDPCDWDRQGVQSAPGERPLRGRGRARCAAGRGAFRPFAGRAPSDLLNDAAVAVQHRQDERRVHFA